MEPEDMNEDDMIASMLEGEIESPMDEAEDLAESGIKPKSEREIESISLFGELVYNNWYIPIFKVKDVYIVFIFLNYIFEVNISLCLNNIRIYFIFHFFKL